MLSEESQPDAQMNSTTNVNKSSNDVPTNSHRPLGKPDVSSLCFPASDFFSNLLAKGIE